MNRPYRTVVVVPSSTRDLTTLDTVKAELGVTNNDHDDFLQMKIRQSSDAIASSCNRRFEQETLEDHFSLHWRTSHDHIPLVLSRIPVMSIVSVVEGNSTIDASNYEVDEKTGCLWRVTANLHSFWFGGKIVVTYVGGYLLLPELPFDIEQACISLVRGSWFSRSRDSSVKSVSVPDVVSYDFVVGGVGMGKSGMPPEVENLIAPYRIPVAL